MLELPRIYKNEGGKYPQYYGLPKLSYSQYDSWRTPKYRRGYVFNYFFGVNLESFGDIFAQYGSEVGEFIETQGEKVGPMLSKFDKDFLLGLDYPENCKYEDEIVYPVTNSKGEILFVIQGFIDRAHYLEGNKIEILDFKTGNMEEKADYYGSLEYGQTTLYSLAKKTEGYEIVRSKVVLLHRKGNNRITRSTGKLNELRLTGDALHIDTPYSDKRAKELIKNMTKVAKEISKAYVVIKKLRQNG